MTAPHHTYQTKPAYPVSMVLYSIIIADQSYAEQGTEAWYIRKHLDVANAVLLTSICGMS